MTESGTGTPDSWRVVAKDGAAFPAAKTTPRPARFHLGAGEIVDVEIAPAPGLHELHVTTFNNFVIPIRAR